MYNDITLDFETFYGDKYSLKQLTTLEYINHERFQILGVSIKQGLAPSVYHHADETDLEQLLKHIFSPGNNVNLICHNTPFDALVLDVVYKLRPARYSDTLSMFRGLAPQMSHSLETMCEALFPNDPSIRKTDELVGFKNKRLEDFTQDDRTTMAAYGCNDTNVTYPCYKAMLGFLPKSECDVIDDTMRLWVEPVLRLNIPRVEKYEEFLRKETEDLVAKSGVSKTTLASRKKFIEFLETEHEIEVPTKISPQTGKPTAALGKSDLAFQALRAETPELAPIWEARLNVSSTGEYSRCKRLIQNATWDDGWMRVALKYYGAHTGRFSGTEKINQQNFKRNSPLRLALEAPQNCYVYVADLAQIEARVLAWLAGQDDLIEDFRRGKDIYSDFASKIYNRKIDRKKLAMDERGNYLDKHGAITDKDNAHTPDFVEGFVGKTCILGLGFGMGPPKFRNTLAEGKGGPPVFISEDDSRDIVYNKYRGTYMNIKDQWDECQKLVYDMAAGQSSYSYKCLELRPNRLILPNGMALNYPRLDSTPDEKNRLQFSYFNGRHSTKIYGGLLTENIVQALARIVVTWQLQQIKREVPEVRFALQVHDELLFVGPRNNAQDIFGRIINCMSIAPPFCADLPVKAEGGYAPEYSK